MVKRTGILTLIAAQNYGAVLQAYALNKYVNDNWGKAETIQYTPKFLKGKYRIIRIDVSNTKLLFLSLISSLVKSPNEVIKKLKFYYFKKKHISLSSSKKAYDYYIVGSDQVFNLELTSYDLAFFLKGVECEKKVTYAASIGLDKCSDQIKECLREGLQDFSAISIREKSGAELLKSIFNDRLIYNNIDPVFLLSVHEWKKFVKKSVVEDKYVLLYTFKSTDEAYSIVKKQLPDYRIVAISNTINKKGKKIHYVKNAGPIDFLSLIYNANYIVTDSFHGCAFSIIFNKSFLALPYEKTSSRMIDLLLLMGLYDRLDKNNIEKNIDYNLVNKRIEQQKESTDYYFRQIYSDNL